MSQLRSVLLAAALVSTLVLSTSACAGPADDASSSGTQSSSPASTESTSEAASSGSVPSETASLDSASSEATPTPAPTPTAPAGPAIIIKISGDKITPNAKEIDLRRGEPLLMTITSDRPGQLHVHSKPEQYVDFKAGTSQQELVIKTPGVVEAEEHDTSAVVAVITVT